MEGTILDVAPNPRRKSAKAAADAFAGQLGSDSGSEPEVTTTKGKRRAPKQLVRYGKQARARTDVAPVNIPSQPASGNITPRPQLAISTQPTGSTSTISSPVRDVTEGASTLVSIQSTKLPGLEDLSDLTSLSSDEPSSPVDVIPKYIQLAKQPLSTDKTLEDTASLSSLTKASTLMTVPIKATASKAPTSRISSPTQTKPKAKQKYTAKEINTNSYVWALVEPETLQAYDQSKDGAKGLWWPGKVQRCHPYHTSLDVTLFGPISKTVQILSPSKVNVLLQLSPFTKMKFGNPTYVPRHGTPARQTQTTLGDQKDITKRWESAVQDMRRDADIIAINRSVSDFDVASLSATDDELPEYVNINHPTSQSISGPPKATFSQGSSKGPTKKKGKHKRGKTTSMDIRYDATEEPDVLLNIPGELVLARDRAQTNIYWPARIDAFVPNANPTRPGKYTVTWVDSSCQDVPREWFYIFSEPEFATCQMGQYLSFFEDKDDPDEDDLTPPEEDRSPSPVPLDPPPSHEDFKALTIREQFVYTKEILRAILDGRYTPSREKHDDFIRGGKWRKNVTNSAAMWGLMDPKDVKTVDKLVQKWCLGREDENEVVDIMKDPLPPPQGEEILGHVKAPNSGQKGLASDASPSPEIAVTETSYADEYKKDSGSAESSSPVTKHPFETSVTSLTDGVGSATPGLSVMSEVEEGSQTKPFIGSTEPNPTSSDYVYPDSAMRFEPSSAFQPLSSSSPPSSSLVASLPGSSQSNNFSAVSEKTSSPPPSSLAPTLTTAGNVDVIYDNISDLTAMEDDESASEVNASAPKERVFVPFKSLTQLVQIEYCSTILVPEAIRQILLWRSGDRMQVGLLSPKEEQTLYDKGAKLLTERDWVFDVKRLREKKVASLRAMKAKGLKSMGGKLSTFKQYENGNSRPRRNLSIQNYQE